ncbi:uncharacterized protein PITG_18806 [Phytophthora infestans T30-4]|uniref:Transmembrane protein n=1 Tax=Phytophthora infestans (strain T30-4) TaxID=403677 RepID=D0NZF7_PHYIT|nr:uncharacterized protein PITG_18806 [Phytophthora infestans T30-4]EEY69511.1 conserved hypothetical protein [Phytophthora infestans T30-4]|eukprot:XP_002997278.1 conserved hypothetical protein [Phytophthora infestans T30-4]
MVLVTSWSDLMSRTVFSLGLISTTTSLKELLRLLPTTIDGGSFGLRSRSSQLVLHLVHLLFAAWGVLVLGLHIQAALQPELPQCTLQVHPWAVSEPACYLAVLDCYRLGISGKMNEYQT